jgi:hypothetical protein
MSSKIMKLQTLIVKILNSLQEPSWNLEYELLLIDENDSEGYENTLKSFANMIINELKNKTKNASSAANDEEIEEYKMQVVSSLNRKTNNFFSHNEEILHIDNRNFVKLVVGHVQSGKSSVICALATYNVLVEKKSSVIIVRNLVGDYKQLRANFEVTEKVTGEQVRGKFADFEIQILFAGDKKDIFNIENIGNALVGTKPCIVIAIANHTELASINQIIQNRGEDNVNFDLIVDECDDLGYKKLMTSRYIQQFNILKNNCTQLVGITATAFDVMFMENELKSGRVFRLERPFNYKGVEQINFVHMDTTTTFDYNNKMNDAMVELYLQIQRNRFENVICDDDEKYLQSHPNICLHKVSTRVGEHEKMIMAFATMKKLKYWTCITYNGQGISVYSQYLVNEESITIAGILGHKNMNGIWDFSGLQVGSILQELRNRDPNAEIFANICIATGLLGSRGINFSSNEDYKWHLTHQVLSTSVGSTTSDLIQSIRLCGVYKYDSVPLTLYTPQKDINDLRNSCVLHEQIIDGIVNNPDENSFVKDVYPRIPVFSDLIPKRKITKKTKKPVFNQIPRPIAEEKEDMEEEFRRLTEIMFPQWSKQSCRTKISLFMKSLDPEKIYNIEEIKECMENVGLVLSSLNALTHIKIGKSNGFGNILKVSGNTYRLYPELVESFKANF